MGLHWQARDAGWLADDLAVSCRTASGEERAAGLSVKTYQQLGRNGFHSDFSTVTWQQWLNQNTSRNFKLGIDAVGLVTGDLTEDVATAWSDLRTQAVQSTPDRVVARLKSNKDDGAQASKVQRAIFASLRRPDALGAERRDEDAHERVLLIRDIRVIRLDFEAQPSSDYDQALLDCQNCLSSGDAAEALKLWERLVGIADEKRPAGGALDLPGLLAMLREQFRFVAHPDFRSDWQTLSRRTALSGFARHRRKLRLDR